MRSTTRIFASLAAIIAIVALARAISDQSRTGAVESLAVQPGLHDAASGLGLLLLGSWFFGKLVAALRIPKISGYLVFGMLVGPSAAQLITGDPEKALLISRDQLDYLKLINELAISIIALTAGGEILFGFLRKHAKLVAAVGALQLVGLCVFLTGLVALIAQPLGLGDELTLTQKLLIGALVATVGVASSPAVIVAVLSETNAHGPFGRTTLAVAIAKDLVLIALFTFVLATVDASLAGAGESTEANKLIMKVGVELFGSLIAGVILGLALAWYVHTINAHLGIVITLAGFGIALISELLHLEALIVALVGGLLMRNAFGKRSERLFLTIENLSLPVYCVFFAVAGAKLDLYALGELWRYALLLALVRAVIIWASTTLGCKLVGADPGMVRWLWSGFVAQAGVSLVLVSIIQNTLPHQPWVDSLFNLLVAMIAIEELVGPALFRLGLARGEPPGTNEHEQPPEDHGGPNQPEASQTGEVSTDR